MHICCDAAYDRNDVTCCSSVHVYIHTDVACAQAVVLPTRLLLLSHVICAAISKMVVFSMSFTVCCLAVDTFWQATGSSSVMEKPAPNIYKASVYRNPAQPEITLEMKASLVEN